MNNNYYIQKEKEIREAYAFLRTNNQSIPDDTIDFMLSASLDTLKSMSNIESPDEEFSKGMSKTEYLNTLYKEDLQLKASLVRANNEIDALENKKKSLFKFIHGKLKGIGFYNRCIMYLASDREIQYIHGVFKNIDSIPYSYCGEGDFIAITFSIEAKLIKMLFETTMEGESGRFTHIISIPIDLFEDDNGDLLKIFIDDFIEKRNQKRSEIMEAAKNKKKAELQAQLKNLDKNN